MCHTFFAFLAFAFLATHAQAQNIPDANFAKKIREQCPACIDANNNLLPPAQELKILGLRHAGISSLEGIEGFINLEELDCAYNQLKSLPVLPATLKTMVCMLNQLTNLPALPATLKRIDCANNRLASLPELPANLENLACFENQLTSLPDLPIHLQDLKCWSNLSIAKQLAKLANLLSDY